ncbi:Talin-1 [Gonapodya sp. JEL0774]|nr:Talin-1 [Gonapodya sp. JEL0774]
MRSKRKRSNNQYEQLLASLLGQDGGAQLSPEEEEEIRRSLMMTGHRPMSVSWRGISYYVNPGGERESAVSVPGSSGTAPIRTPARGWFPGLWSLFSPNQSISLPDRDDDEEPLQVATFEHSLQERHMDDRGRVAILEGIAGSVKPGQVCAIMGGSGAGKTTFLDILAGRQKSGVVAGEILVNGVPMAPDEYKRSIGFVDQEDTLIETLTVRETITYSALLRLPQAMSNDAKRFRVREAMVELGILGIADRRIGGTSNRGISGGEKRRVSIACELVTSPSILYLDEPTSGLDSFNAYNVIECLVTMARNYQRTVILTIHQPRSNIYALFDQLVLLAKGKMIFSGAAQDIAIKHFSHLGFHCPVGFNMADYFVDLTMHIMAGDSDLAHTLSESDGSNQTGQPVSPTSRLGFPSFVERNRSVKAIQEDRLFTPHPEVASTPRSSQGTSLSSINTDKRSPSSSVGPSEEIHIASSTARRRRDGFLNDWQGMEDHLAYLVDGFRTSTIFRSLERSIADEVANHRREPDLIGISSTVPALTNSLQNGHNDHDAFASRTFKNMYRNPNLLLGHYAVTLFVAVIFDIVPLRVLPPLILGLIVYPMIGLRSESLFYILKFLMVLVLFNLTSASVCLTIGIIISEIGLANLISTLVMLFAMLYGGLLLNKASVPEYLGWLRNLSFFNFAVEALIVNEVNGLTLVEDKFGLKINFAGDTSVHEACKEVRDRLGDATGGPDHGLFHPDTRQWLAPNRVLDYYNLKSGDVVEYKKKTRPLKVRLADETTKTVLIDESVSVKQLVEYICEKIGIANPDEYSLQTDIRTNSTRKSNETLARREKKMKGSQEDLSEEGRWLLPEKCLAEQGITDMDIVVLKKKFFFSDQNVDRNDPVQLNLIYNQSRESILQGKYPCTPDEAIQFAALQAQVQFGNFEPERHKAGFFKLKDFLPEEYHRERMFEKRILAEHQKLHGMSELNAKFRYVQLCRSLKTYGVTFFIVKEKAAKKNKIGSMLLGVTKESVVRLDVETKEIIKSWPITQLRRWAASPNSLTLDFGDYADAYYSVQTTEGEAISSLIGGYIDIILKKKRDAERSVEIEAEEMPVTEEYMRPARANIINIHSGSALKTADQGNIPVQASISAAAMATLQTGNVATSHLAFHTGGNNLVLGEVYGAQQALLQTINNGFAAIQSAATDLTIPTQLPPLGDDETSQQWRQQTVDVNGENIATLIAAHLAAAASVINHTAVDSHQIDFDSLAVSIATLSSNLPQITQALKIVSGLSGDADSADLLLRGAEKMVFATQEFLQATQSGILGTGNRSDIYQSAQKLSAVSVDILTQLRVLDINEDSQAAILNAAKAIAGATGGLVAAARDAANASSNPLQRDIILQEAKRCAASAAMIVAGTNLVAPVVGNSVALEQIADATMFLRDSVAMLMENAQSSGQNNMSALISAASWVEDAICKLIGQAQSGGSPNMQTGVDREFDQFVDAVQSMRECVGAPELLVQRARDLTNCSTNLVSLLRADTEESDATGDRQHFLQVGLPVF